MTASPTLSYEFGDSFGFEVYVPFESETLESNENDSHSQNCSPISYHHDNIMKNGDNGCDGSDGSDRRTGSNTVYNDDKYKYYNLVCHEYAEHKKTNIFTYQNIIYTSDFVILENNYIEIICL